MIRITVASAKLIGLLEVAKDRELTDNEWLALGRVFSAISVYAKLHKHSLSPLTGSNLNGTAKFSGIITRGDSDGH